MKQIKSSSAGDAKQANAALADALKDEKRVRDKLGNQLAMLKDELTAVKTRLEYSERNTASLEALLKTKASIELEVVIAILHTCIAHEF